MSSTFRARLVVKDGKGSGTPKKKLTKKEKTVNAYLVGLYVIF